MSLFAVTIVSIQVSRDVHSMSAARIPILVAHTRYGTAVDYNFMDRLFN